MLLQAEIISITRRNHECKTFSKKNVTEPDGEYSRPPVGCRCLDGRLLLLYFDFLALLLMLGLLAFFDCADVR